MSFLDLANIKFSYDGNQLYNDLNLRVFSDDHLALVGVNGSGKSTLLKIIGKKLSPDKGEINYLDNLSVGYLDQHQDVGNHLNVGDYLYDVFKDLYHLELEMLSLYDQMAIANQLEIDRLLQQTSNITDKLEKEGFYQVSSKISNMVHGLGLSLDILKESFDHLSGGMKAKVILAKLLLEEHDLLLLDEPTNFLDVAHVSWLTKFLNNYNKAFIVVSHDEDFLNDIAKSVIELRNKTLEKYKGDYQFYLKERIIRYDQHSKAYNAQVKKINETKEFIEKNITRASTTKRAQSRRKMLEKLTIISKPIKDKTYSFKFNDGISTGKDVLSVNDLVIGYDEPLIEKLSFNILKGDKVVITGKNGIGKTTLLKTLLGEVDALDGVFSWIDTAQVAYLPQIASFDNNSTAFNLISSKYPNLDTKANYALLASYGIDYEKANRKLSTLSGGEQTKVMLSLIRYTKTNVLILDEPTNHLDVKAKDALKEAIRQFNQTIILVSHEKSFYEGLCDYEIELFT